MPVPVGAETVTTFRMIKAVAVFEFGALPPEINSARLYAGPGSGPMMAAAAAWDALACELNTAALVYSEVISELTSGRWAGPASAAMVSAIMPFRHWLSVTAEQVEQVGSQARSAAAAYEEAFLLTVPPPVVMANRVELTTLIATNFFGQNTPSIAANEAEYAQMWAQDATAMYGYASSSTAAWLLSPFASPPNTVNSAGVLGQAAAVGVAAVTPTGTAESTLMALAASPATAVAATEWLQWLETHLPHLTIDNRTAIVRFLGESYFWFGTAAFVSAIAQTLIPGTPASAGSAGSSVLDGWGPALAAGLGVVPVAPGGAAGGLPALPGHALMPLHAQPATAALGHARSIGVLSTPTSWSPEVSIAPEDFGQQPLDMVRTGSGGGPVDGVLQGLPLGKLGSSAGGFTHRYGFRYKVMPRPPCVG